MIKTLTSPADPRDELLEFLLAQAGALDHPSARPETLWPRASLAALTDAGVYRWFEPVEHGGFGWDDAAQLRGYLDLSEACLTTAFILTQRSGAVRRIAAYASEELRAEILPDLLSGKTFATVAISHLTTSRQHVAAPAVVAQPVVDGWILDGSAPWVTGATFADFVVVGATQPDGRQVLLCVPGNEQGVLPQPPMQLTALTASCTGPLDFEGVHVARENLLAGPTENVLTGASGAKTGGLTTSALAIGHAGASISFIENEALKRRELELIVPELRREQQELVEQLLQLAAGNEVCPAPDLRARANSMALRAAQSALAAAKGAGFAAGHPAGRYAREALFFLVWSCPQLVVTANLCELAGIE